jgi:exodeoxyribonuclease-3
MVKIISWNVNGLRTRIIDDGDAKSFSTKTSIHPQSHLGRLLTEFSPDIICFQETRCSLETTQKFQIPEWKCYYNSSQGEGARSGNRYSGVAIWTKKEPLQVLTDLPFLPEPNREGRFIALYYNDFILINCYQPNSGSNFDYRISTWDPAMYLYLQFLKEEYDLPIIWTGDLNVAHTHHDLFLGDPQYLYCDDIENRINLLQKHLQTPIMQGIGPNTLIGFTIEERQDFTNILELGFIDVWRHIHPHNEVDDHQNLDLVNNNKKGYTWWNMRMIPYRKLNKGWRIDYFIIDDKHKHLIQQCLVFKHIGEPILSNDTGALSNKVGSDTGALSNKVGSDTGALSNKVGSDHAPIGIELNI